MKILLNSALALMMLATVTAAFNTRHAKFGSPHWVEYPCISGQTIQGKIAGLGQGDITIVISGQFDCQNPGDQDPPNWQNFTREIHGTVTKNGNYILNSNLKVCPNKNWTPFIQNSVITVYAGTTASGPPVIEPTNFTNCQ